MLNKTLTLFLFIIIISCTNKVKENKIKFVHTATILPTKIIETPLPKGFERVKQDTNSFAYYLQNINLKKDNTVYYFDGTKKTNQNLHYAVLDISVPKKDLQQCADAVMRLRAEYFFTRKEYDKIEFKSTATIYNFSKYWMLRSTTNMKNIFNDFMEIVFANCGTYNLADMLKPKPNANDLAIGDVFVKAGSPGHAMIVVDLAVNKTTQEKIFLLAQSFMPAQSIHIVKNLNNKNLSPWYKVDTSNFITTPGYMFNWNHLKTW